MEWRVRPGLYQPGLYVTGNTGQNVEEWLRHLQDPNPLPYIEPAAAPAPTDGGDGGAEKQHDDDEQNN